MTLMETLTKPFVDDRLAQRRQIKARIIASRKEWSQIEAIGAAVVAAEQEVDRATAQHGEACAPIQNQLAEIQSRQVDAMIDRADADPALELRRLELLEELDIVNEQLSETCRRCHDKIVRLNAESGRLVVAAGRTSPESLRNELMKLGDDELLADLRFAQGDVESLTSRLAVSEQLLNQAERELKRLRAIKKPDSHDRQQTTIQENRERRNRLDAKRLVEALAAATHRASQLQAEIVNE